MAGHGRGAEYDFDDVGGGAFGAADDSAGVDGDRLGVVGVGECLGFDGGAVSWAGDVDGPEGFGVDHGFSVNRIANMPGSIGPSASTWAGVRISKNGSVDPVASSTLLLESPGR